MKKLRQNSAFLAPKNRSSAAPSVGLRLSWKAAVSGMAFATTLAGTLATLPNTAQALALGRMSVQSSLGEPLRAELDVPEITAEEAASLRVSIANPDAFRAAGMEFNAALIGAQISLQRRADGRSFLRLSSDKIINEPFVDVIVEANWAGGRSVRDYTLLLDPPTLRQAPPAPVVMPALPAAPSVASPAPAAPLSVPPPAIASSAVQANTAVVTAKPALGRSSPDTKPKMESSNQVQVKLGDTAAAIAQRVKPAGVSLEQMLVALLRGNPSAFIGDDVNRLRAGAVLDVPTQQAAAAISPADATRILRAQSVNFNAFRQKLAQAAPRVNAPQTPKRQATGKVQSEVKDSTAAAQPADKLKLAKATAASAAQTDAIAKTKQAEEAAKRKAELERNAADLAKAATSAASAKASTPGPAPSAATTAATGAKPGSSAAGLPITAPMAATPVASVAASAASAAKLSASAAVVAASASVAASVAALSTSSNAAPTASSPASSPASSALSSAASAAASSAAASAPTAASAPAKQAVSAPPPPPPEPSFIESLTQSPFVPLALLAALAVAGGLSYKRWRDKKRGVAHVDSSFLESRLQPDSFFGASGGQQINTSSTNAPPPGSSMVYSASQIDAAGDVDPVAEADVYLAYGRDLQAEEILKEALRTAPKRVAIHAKLLDIHAKRRDLKTYELVARELLALTGGEGPEWDRAAEVGRDLEPGNPLYRNGSGGSSASSNAEPPAGGAAAAVATVAFSAATVPTTAYTAPVPTTDIDLDLDFSLGDEAAAPAAPTISSALEPTLTMAAMPQAEDNGMAFDLDVSSFGDDAAARAATPNLPDLGMKLSLPDLTAADNGLSFSPSPLPAASPATKPAPSLPDPNALSFDLGDLSLDLDARPPVPSVMPQDTGEDTASDSLETKLALAREFHEIGDKEGALELVREVIAEGSGTLKTRAQKMLSELR